MKYFKPLLCLTLLLLSITGFSQEQQEYDALNLGKLSAFKARLLQKVTLTTTQRATDKPEISVQVASGNTIGLDVNFQKQTTDQLTLIGSVSGHENSSFFIKVSDEGLKGNIILKDDHIAYEYTQDANGEVYITEKDIVKVICVEYPKSGNDYSDARTLSTQATAADAYALESLPGAEACVLLDFDGYNLPAGTGWMDGEAWTAEASGMTDAQIEATWLLVSEDYRAFDVNVTTSQSVFDSYAQSRRQRCVFTPDDSPAPGAGGVAYVTAFGYNDWPCWVFMMAPKAGGEAASHEIGHTVGLSHDGRTNPSEEYFLGHADWAPIMGAGYYVSVSQWSKGEYDYASNTEDDLSVMSGYINFRSDDHGDSFSGATNISIDASGNATAQSGVISTTGDVDMFSFTCGTGSVSLDINTIDTYGDLDILVNLYEGSSGNLIGVFDDDGLDVHLDAYLDAGTYYIGVDGTGYADPATDGYSDYASLGSFTISGTIPYSGSSDGPVTLYEDCNYGGYAVSLGVGSYNMAALQALGVSNDDISSLTVESGYQVTLYWDIDFAGTTLVKTGDDACLVDDEFNDEATSIVIAKTTTTVATIEAEDYTSMSGVEIEDCSDTGGGSNVGYIETGDWMAYSDITFPSTGTYLIKYRVASESGGGVLSLDLDAGSIVLGTVDIPSTGAWQTWTTVSHTVTVDAGTYALGIYAATGGWNINWIEITQQGAALAQSESESFEVSNGLNVDEPSSITLYPNPTQGEIKCDFEGDFVGGKVINTSGQEVMRISNLQSGEAIDVSSLKTGIYLFSISTENATVIKRVVKK